MDRWRWGWSRTWTGGGGGGVGRGQVEVGGGPAGGDARHVASSATPFPPVTHSVCFAGSAGQSNSTISVRSPSCWAVVLYSHLVWCRPTHLFHNEYCKRCVPSQVHARVLCHRDNPRNKRRTTVCTRVLHSSKAIPRPLTPRPHTPSL